MNDRPTITCFLTIDPQAGIRQTNAQEGINTFESNWLNEVTLLSLKRPLIIYAGCHHSYEANPLGTVQTGYMIGICSRVNLSYK